jgi:asparagine synthase (glutamine-hydrolysing)
MSGFFCALSPSGAAPDEAALRSVAEASAHRGIARAWHGDGVAMIAFEGRRGNGLAAGEDFVVALDARIDNARELDRMLGLAPGTTDAARVLAAWRRWGADTPRRLVGDFAGAVFDRATRALVVFRDPGAGRHALLGRARGGLVAASSLPMLLADPGVARDVDEEWVAAFLTATAGFATVTGYRDATRLVPGARAHARGGEWRVERWHSWSARRVRERDPRAYAEGLREVLFEAVRARIDGAKRAGVSLSGGLDSTSVIASARAVAPDASLVALAVPFTAERADERALQQMVAERVGATLRWAPLDGASPYGEGGARATIERLGVPPIAPNHFFVERVAAAAADAGADVVLDGIDGDAIVGGNWYFLGDLLATGRALRFRRELRAAARVHGMSARRVVRDYVVEPMLPGWARARRTEAPPFVLKDFAARTKMTRRMTAGPWRPGRAFAAHELQAVAPGIAPAILEQIEETFAARGIEAAHPWLDARVVEYCLGLPRAQKVADGWTKIVLREAMRALLPADVTGRSAKAELGSAFFSALSAAGRADTEEGLERAASNLDHWVNPRWGLRLAGGSGGSPEGFVDFRLAFLSHWRGWVSDGWSDGGSAQQRIGSRRLRSARYPGPR